MWVDFDSGDVRLLVDVFDSGLVHVSITHLYFESLVTRNGRGAGYHMGIGDNQPRLRHNKT